MPTPLRSEIGRILEQLGPKSIAANMQRLVDHLIYFCIQNQAHQTTLNAVRLTDYDLFDARTKTTVEMVETLDKLIWTWWVIPVCL